MAKIKYSDLAEENIFAQLIKDSQILAENLDLIKKKLQDNGKELKKVASQKLTADNMNEVISATEKLKINTQQLNEVKKREKELTEAQNIAMNTEAGSYNRLSAEQAKMRKELLALNQSTEEGKKKADELRKTLNENEKQLTKLGDTFTNNKRGIRSYTESIKEAIAEHTPFAGSIMNVAGKMTSFAGGGIALAVAGLGTFAKGLQLNKEIADKLGQTVAYLDGAWQSMALNLTGVSSNVFEVAEAFRQAKEAEQDYEFISIGSSIAISKLNAEKAELLNDVADNNKGYNEKIKLLQAVIDKNKKIFETTKNNLKIEEETIKGIEKQYGLSNGLINKVKEGFRTWTPSQMPFGAEMAIAEQEINSTEASRKRSRMTEEEAQKAIQTARLKYAEITKIANEYLEKNKLFSIEENELLNKVENKNLIKVFETFKKEYDAQTEYEASIKKAKKRKTALEKEAEDYNIKVLNENIAIRNELITTARNKELAIEKANYNKLRTEHIKNNALQKGLNQYDLKAFEDEYLMKKAKINEKYDLLDLDNKQKHEKAVYSATMRDKIKLLDLEIEQSNKRIALLKRLKQNEANKLLLTGEQDKNLGLVSTRSDLAISQAETIERLTFVVHKATQMDVYEFDKMVLQKQIDYELTQNENKNEFLINQNKLKIEKINQQEKELSFQNAQSIRQSNEDVYLSERKLFDKNEDEKNETLKNDYQFKVAQAEKYKAQMAEIYGLDSKEFIEANNKWKIALNDQQKFLKDLQKKEITDLAKAVTDATEFTLNQFINASKKKMEVLDMEFEASKNHEETLRALAQTRTEGALQNLAFEQKRQAEIQREKMKLLKEQLRMEQAIAAVKLLEGMANKPNNGTSTLTGLLSNIKGYATGGLVTGNEKFIRINEEGEEFVNNAESTRRYMPILEDMNNLQFNPMKYLPIGNAYNDEAQKPVVSELAEIKNAIKSQSTLDDVMIDKLTNSVIYRFKQDRTIYETHTKSRLS